jgi:hypothetical protein
MLIDWVTAGVAGTLAERGIELIVMKGPVVRALLYEHGEVREYLDSDVLLAEAHLPHAREVLRQLGFSLRASPPRARRREERWERDRDGVRVELHWTVWGAEAPPEEVLAALRASACPLEVGGREVKALGPGASALYLALHAAQHGRSAAATYKELELALVRLESEHWTEAAALARRIGATAAFGAGLRMTSAGATLALELGLPESSSPAALLAAEGASGTARYLEELSSLRGPRARLGYLWKVLFPPRAVMAEDRFGGRGRAGLVAAYAWRLLRGVGGLVPGLVALRRASRNTGGE